MTTWAGGAFGQRARCVLAPNADFMTLDGTNTWVLREPGARRSVVIDPGPEIESHLDAVAEVAGEVAAVLLTHGHLDHSEAARSFAERMGCGVRALDPAHRLGSEGLGDGDVVEVDGLEVHVVGTPGHTSDSLSFVVPAEGAVLTGDTVLGRGTTVVDGSLADYLDSLQRLRELGHARALPAHGPELESIADACDALIAHREQRLDQVRAALSQRGADATVQQVTDAVYPDVDPSVRFAAELSVQAQLDYLRERG